VLALAYQDGKTGFGPLVLPVGKVVDHRFGEINALKGLLKGSQGCSGSAATAYEFHVFIL
jgi:hypothetical protein